LLLDIIRLIRVVEVPCYIVGGHDRWWAKLAWAKADATRLPQNQCQ
jgi:hypothetical protein